MIFNKKNKLKTDKRFRHRKKISNASLSVDTDKDRSILSLKVNGSFKMAVIIYEGTLAKIIRKRFTKLKVIHNVKKNKIIVINPHRVKLKNNILFAFKGNISKFTKANIYGWGQKQIPIKTTTLHKVRDDINMDQNLISSHDKTMR
tara:strand:- start:1323 stop:1760 length:438 start_codon:yes stop_codon:yes gene_type:complete